MLTGLIYRTLQRTEMKSQVKRYVGLGPEGSLVPESLSIGVGVHLFPSTRIRSPTWRLFTAPEAWGWSSEFQASSPTVDSTGKQPPSWSRVGIHQEALHLYKPRYSDKGLFLMNNKRHSSLPYQSGNSKGLGSSCARNQGWKPNIYILFYHIPYIYFLFYYNITNTRVNVSLNTQKYEICALWFLLV